MIKHKDYYEQTTISNTLNNRKCLFNMNRKGNDPVTEIKFIFPFIDDIKIKESLMKFDNRIEETVEYLLNKELEDIDKSNLKKTNYNNEYTNSINNNNNNNNKEENNYNKIIEDIPENNIFNNNNKSNKDLDLSCNTNNKSYKLLNIFNTKKNLSDLKRNNLNTNNALNSFNNKNYFDKSGFIDEVKLNVCNSNDDYYDKIVSEIKDNINSFVIHNKNLNSPTKNYRITNIIENTLKEYLLEEKLDDFNKQIDIEYNLLSDQRKTCNYLFKNYIKNKEHVLRNMKLKEEYNTILQQNKSKLEEIAFLEQYILENKIN